MRRIIMVSINDFETFEDYVRYRETYGYTEHELDCMNEILETTSQMTDEELEMIFEEDGEYELSEIN